jgi:hypothetical protein
MSFSLAIILILFAWMLGAQWSRIRTEAKLALYGAKAERSALGWWVRSPVWKDRIHLDQECIEAVEPPHNIWTEPRMPCWYEMLYEYRPFRVPRLKHGQAGRVFRQGQAPDLAACRVSRADTLRRVWAYTEERRMGGRPHDRGVDLRGHRARFARTTHCGRWEVLGEELLSSEKDSGWRETPRKNQ